MAIPAQNVITDLISCNNIPTFVAAIDKGMETTLIRIGNSRGIIIPAAILKKKGVKDGARVKLEEKGDNTFVLSFPPEEDPYTGPFTGPFKALAIYKEMEDPWGGVDSAEYIRQLRDETGVEKRDLSW